MRPLLKFNLLGIKAFFTSGSKQRRNQFSAYTQRSKKKKQFAVFSPPRFNCLKKKSLINKKGDVFPIFVVHIWVFSSFFFADPFFWEKASRLVSSSSKQKKNGGERGFSSSFLPPPRKQDAWEGIERGEKEERDWIYALTRKGSDFFQKERGGGGGGKKKVQSSKKKDKKGGRNMVKEA